MSNHTITDSTGHHSPRWTYYTMFLLFFIVMVITSPYHSFHAPTFLYQLSYQEVPIEFKSISKKITAGECLSILILGGSISSGHAVRPTEVWHTKFIDNYNRHFGVNCSSFKIDHAISGTGSDNAVTYIKEVVPSYDYDLIFVEFGNNDAQLGEHPEINQMTQNSNIEHALLFYAEILVPILTISCQNHLK